MNGQKRRTAPKEEMFVGFRADAKLVQWLEVGARVMGSKSAVLRAVLGEAMAQGMTFGAKVRPEAVRKAGGA